MNTFLAPETGTLEQAAELLLASAKKAGATHAEVCGTFSEQTRITLEKQDFHLASSNDGFQLGLRVMCGAKAGFASANSTAKDDLQTLAKQAVEIALFSPENALLAIGPNQGENEAKSFFPESDLHRFPLQKQKAWAQELMTCAVSAPRFRLNEGSVEVSSSLFLVASSLGTHKVEQEHQAGWSLMGMGVDGDNITSFDYFSEMARHSRDVGQRLSATTKAFCEDVVRGLKTGPGKSYKGFVFFSPRAVIDIFMSGLSTHLNGRSVVENTGKWKLTDREQKVLDAAVSLKDLPHALDRSGACRFDREGATTANRSLVDKGVLKSFVVDQYAANALKIPSTGNSVGGPAGLPSAGAHCLVLEGGKEPLKKLQEDIFSRQNECLWVNRFSGQVDSVTGDFSGVAKGAEWWVKGERAYYVKETLISGNIFECLGSALAHLSKETQVLHASWEAPTLISGAVSVTTK